MEESSLLEVSGDASSQSPVIALKQHALKVKAAKILIGLFPAADNKERIQDMAPLLPASKVTITAEEGHK